MNNIQKSEFFTSMWKELELSRINLLKTLSKVEMGMRQGEFEGTETNDVAINIERALHSVRRAYTECEHLSKQYREAEE